MEPTEYLPRLRAAFPHRTDIELELICSSDKSFQRKTGKSPHDHRRLAMEGMFPRRVWHAWREERMQSIQECLERGIQELTWMGSSNSNKTADMADAAVTLWLTKPETTSIYVTSPYESATETGLWANILEQFHEAKDANPALPGKERKSDNSIVLHDRNPRSFIRVTTVDQIGKLVGKKSRDFGEGLLVILADESPAFSPVASRALIRVLTNLWSVPNFMLINAGNFADTGDLLGVLSDPDEKDIPNGWDGFDADRHFRWRTKRGGLALRFDGLRSPNVLAGEDKLPFVTTLAYIAKIAAQPGGLQSPDAMRFVRSSPVTSLNEFTVTNGERIRAGGCLDSFEWTADEILIGAFVDPGFGGDPCAMQKFKLGFTRIPGGRRHTLALWDAPHYIPVRVGLKDDDGQPIPPETQIAKGAKEISGRFGIPDSHVGYDGSMRANLAQKIGLIWSPHVVAIDSQGPATTRAVSATEKKEDGTAVTWKERVDRLLSEFWFATSHAIDSFQIRGLQLSPKAVNQLCARRWNWAGRKKKVETKQEYKDSLIAQGKTGESPNEADAVVGCVEMARRMGFNLEGLAPQGGSLKLILDIIDRRAASHFRPLSAKQGLPSGRLHARQAPKTTRLARHYR
jgi:hypothetical protein